MNGQHYNPNNNQKPKGKSYCQMNNKMKETFQNNAHDSFQKDILYHKQQLEKKDDQLKTLVAKVHALSIEKAYIQSKIQQMQKKQQQIMRLHQNPDIKTEGTIHKKMKVQDGPEGLLSSNQVVNPEESKQQQKCYDVLKLLGMIKLEIKAFKNDHFWNVMARLEQQIKDMLTKQQKYQDITELLTTSYEQAQCQILKLYKQRAHFMEHIQQLEKRI